jgi:tellurite resistance protein TerC
MFRYLKTGVSFILLFIGVKMLLSSVHPIGEFFSRNSWVSLAVIIGTLTISILMSMLISERKESKELKETIEDFKDKLD